MKKKVRSKTKTQVKNNPSIYMDFAGATPISEGVKKAMFADMDNFYNPSSLYQKGVEAKQVVEECRKKTAELINARPQEIIFTSSGTESNNLAIRGLAEKIENRMLRPHILVSAIEHASVLEPVRSLAKYGFEIEEMLPNESGVIEAAEIRKKIRKETVLVSVMLVNNEIGVIEPVKEIAKEVRHARKVFGHEFPYFHTDASQGFCFLDIDVVNLGVDLLTLDSSKCYGPKGGVLFKKASVTLESQMQGGGQERGLRSGTENLFSIVGITEALSESAKKSKKETDRLLKLRQYFEKSIVSKFEGAEINASLADRVPHISSVYMPKLDAEFALFQLDRKGMMCATSSACQSNKKNASADDGSYVVDALYGKKDPARKNSTLRFSFGRTTTKKEIDFCLDALFEVICSQWTTSPNSK